jgi:hypothetical protein
MLRGEEHAASLRVRRTGEGSDSLPCDVVFIAGEGRGGGAVYKLSLTVNRRAEINVEW